MWFKWTLIAVLALGPLMNIAQIEKPREPVSRTYAIISFLVNGLVIWGLLTYWQ